MRMDDEYSQGNQNDYTPPERGRVLIDNRGILNIEIGAGTGRFGQIFYPTCYLVDFDETLTEYYLDWHCPAHKLPWRADRFEHVIMCNPWGYGFDTDESTTEILDEITRVVKHDGKIIVLGHKASKYSGNLERRVQAYQTLAQVKLELQSERIDPQALYPGHKFFQTDGKTETKPNLKFTIHVTKS